MSTLTGSAHSELPADLAPRQGSLALDRAASWAWAPAFGAWCAVVAWAVPLHEPWFDEAQAWLLARDAGLWELLGRMSYEGSPPLWHLLLVPLAKAGAPYLSMQVLGAACAAVAAYLIMRHAPFPLLLRLALPFGYFGLYQYAVVARSYCLLMPLAFAAAILYPRRRERPGTLAAVLILAGMTSVFGYLLAAGILAAHAHEIRPLWNELPEAIQRRQRRAFIAFGAYSLLLVPMLCPHFDFGGALPNHQMWPGTLLHVAWWMIDGAFASQWLATIAVLGVSVWWFRQKGVLRLFLFPSVALLVLFLAVRANWWYQGVLFLAWAFALWQSYADAPRGKAALAMAGAAGLLLAFQIPAAARTLRDDAVEPYSGSKAAAEYLQSHQVESVFARGFATPAVLPYLRASPFVNAELPPSKSYYPWTKRTNELQDDAHLDSTGAEYVLVSLKFEKRPLPFPGFGIAARFPGSILWKGQHIEDETYVLLRRLPAPDRMP